MHNRVSAEGSVVVGEGIFASGYEAFRWTSGGGMVGLGYPPGASFDSRAHGVFAIRTCPWSPPRILTARLGQLRN